MSNNSDELKIELDDDVAQALAAMLFDVPESSSALEPDAVIDLRESVIVPESSIPDLFAAADSELAVARAISTDAASADEVVEPEAIEIADDPSPLAPTDSPSLQSRLFPARPAKPKPVVRSSAPLFPTSATVVRQSGTAAGLFGPPPTPADDTTPVVKSVLGPLARSAPSSVEFVPAVDTRGPRNYRIIGGVALGAVATIGALAFAFGGANDAPVTSADVSLIPATQISNTTPTTARIATSLSTAPPPTAAATTEAPTTAAPTTAAPAAPVATQPQTTRRPRTTAAPATAPPTTVQAATVPTLDLPPATYIVTTTVLPAPTAAPAAETVTTP